MLPDSRVYNNNNTSIFSSNASFETSSEKHVTQLATAHGGLA